MCNDVIMLPDNHIATGQNDLLLAVMHLQELIKVSYNFLFYISNI